MQKSWVFGANPDCDVVVALPTVSGYHCRLTHTDAGAYLEDLGSTNGTWVNGTRITSKIKVTRADRITLGMTAALPWPADASATGPSPQARVMTIGREADNDFVIPLPIVSGHHARLLWDEGTKQAWIEDLGSSNGTAIGAPDRKITRSVLLPSDTVYFGTHPVGAADLVARVQRTAQPAPAPSASRPQTPTVVASNTHDPSGGLSQEWAQLWERPWVLPALVAQAPLLALAIGLSVGAAGAPATAENSVAAARAVPNALFFLSLTALWFGLSNALFANAVAGTPAKPESGPMARMSARLLLLGAVCIVQCVLAWGLFAVVSGLPGTGLGMLAFLVLGGMVGVTIGILVGCVIVRPAYALAAAAGIMLSFGVLGGDRWPLPAMPGWTKPVVSIAPSRWAFEGLLLLVSERFPANASAAEGSSGAADLAEPFFPSETERMGVKADAIALGSMLIGLAGCAVFFAGNLARRTGGPIAD
jgi:pSer/pThr/pTyr-binding forkhead associated (FHA) protein